MENKNLHVRKGAWTKEEDTLLRNCIDKFGEGKWHKVPQRAGLNRCRKSCRLRWLNYLRPNLKKGYFNEDKVDLLLRLHKLLGNRWSLIAGRIPGRTGNDVKNFWNTHILKKSKSSETSKTEKHIIFKPRPRSFSHGGNSNKKPSSLFSIPDDWKNTSVDDEFPLIYNAPFSMSEQEVDECIRWWLETPDDQPVFSPTQINQKIAEFTNLAEDAAHDGSM